jgi:hypothetical protein
MQIDKARRDHEVNWHRFQLPRRGRADIGWQLNSGPDQIRSDSLATALPSSNLGQSWPSGCRVDVAGPHTAAEPGEDIIHCFATVAALPDTILAQLLAQAIVLSPAACRPTTKSGSASVGRSGDRGNPRRFIWSAFSGEFAILLRVRSAQTQARWLAL